MGNGAELLRGAKAKGSGQLWAAERSRWSEPSSTAGSETAREIMSPRVSIKTAGWRLLETDGAGVRAGLAGVTAGAGAVVEEAFSTERDLLGL